MVVRKSENRADPRQQLAAGIQKPISFPLLIFYFMCMSVLPSYKYLCTTCVPAAVGDQKKALDPLELKV